MPSRSGPTPSDRARVLTSLMQDLMVGDGDKCCLELGEGVASETARMPLLDRNHDLVGGTHLFQPTLRGTDQFGPAVGGVGLALDVAECLQLVDHRADHLLV